MEDTDTQSSSFPLVWCSSNEIKDDVAACSSEDPFGESSCSTTRVKINDSANDGSNSLLLSNVKSEPDSSEDENNCKGLVLPNIPVEVEIEDDDRKIKIEEEDFSYGVQVQDGLSYEDSLSASSPIKEEGACQIKVIGVLPRKAVQPRPLRNQPLSPEEEGQRTECVGCGSKVKRILSHLNKKPDCKKHYNIEELKAESKAKRRQSQREWQANYDKLHKEKRQKYRKEHREEIRLKHQKYNKEHEEEIRLKRRKYYQECQENLQLMCQKYNLKHWEEIQPKHLGN